MPNTSDWDSPDFLMDLGIALFTAAQANKSLPVPVKEAIEEYLKGRGWKTSFDAIRYVTLFLSFFLSLHTKLKYQFGLVEIAGANTVGGAATQN
ncbi:hypothetical protein ACHAPT_007764 [Fusarium lateritium]